MSPKSKWERSRWSNELALHVIELKTNGPASRLEPLVKLFQEQVCRLNTILQPMGAQLLPTAMHPWMDPDRELKLWPHEYNPIYEAYNGIFDCRGHGWANVQSTHLNLPFADDDEFGRLHAAIRLLMPLLPALAASSPIVDRALTGLADYRMEVYRSNSRPVPSVTADVIPEPVYSRGDYEQKILQRMYRDIAPLDTQGVLRHEWLNSRGAIARFRPQHDRNPRARCAGMPGGRPGDLRRDRGRAPSVGRRTMDQRGSTAIAGRRAAGQTAQRDDSHCRPNHHRRPPLSRTIRSQHNTHFGARLVAVSHGAGWQLACPRRASNDLARRPLGDPHRTSNPRRRIAHGVGLPRLVRLPGSRTHVYKGEARFLNRGDIFTALWRIRWARS